MRPHDRGRPRPARRSHEPTCASRAESPPARDPLPSGRARHGLFGFAALREAVERSQIDVRIAILQRRDQQRARLIALPRRDSLHRFQADDRRFVRDPARQRVPPGTAAIGDRRRRIASRRTWASGSAAAMGRTDASCSASTARRRTRAPLAGSLGRGVIRSTRAACPSAPRGCGVSLTASQPVEPLRFAKAVDRRSLPAARVEERPFGPLEIVGAGIRQPTDRLADGRPYRRVGFDREAAAQRSSARRQPVGGPGSGAFSRIVQRLRNRVRRFRAHFRQRMPQRRRDLRGRASVARAARARAPPRAPSGRPRCAHRRGCRQVARRRRAAIFGLQNREPARLRPAGAAKQNAKCMNAQMHEYPEGPACT